VRFSPLFFSIHTSGFISYPEATESRRSRLRAFGGRLWLRSPSCVFFDLGVPGGTHTHLAHIESDWCPFFLDFHIWKLWTLEKTPSPVLFTLCPFGIPTESSRISGGTFGIPSPHHWHPHVMSEFVYSVPIGT